MRYILLLPVLICSLYVFSQQGTLQGNIASNQKSVGFCTIVIDGDSFHTGTSSNESGFFSITLPVGTYTAKVSALGFSSVKRTIHIKENQTLTENFVLKEDVLGLEQVVVTASRGEVPLYQSPVITHKISTKTLELTPSLSLSEGLNFSPGLRMETNCQNCGFNQLRINGLEGAYSQILINSRPVFSALAGVYGLEMIPSNMIDRIEVVKGGGSALYGGNAIGGTVNIITRNPVENTISTGSNLSFLGGKTPDRTVFVNGAVVSDKLDKGMSFFAYNRHRDPFDANGDGFSEMTQLRNNTFGGHFFWNPTDRHKIQFNINSITEFRRGGNKFDQPPHEADITEQLQHQILGGDFTLDITSKNLLHKVKIYASAQNIERKSYYGSGGFTVNSLDDIDHIDVDQQRVAITQIREDLDTAQHDFDEEGLTAWAEEKFPNKNSSEIQDIVAQIQSKSDYFTALNSYGKSYDLSAVAGVQYNYQFNPDVHLSLGSEYQYNRVEDIMSGYQRSIDQKVGTWGNFAQLQWDFSRWSAVVGLRHEIAKLDGVYQFSSISQPTSRTFFNFAPRLTLKYDLSDHWKLRTSFAQGYRIPQAFDEDLHVASVGGETLFTQLSSDLKPEKSNAFTASVNYVKTEGDWQSSVVLEGFFTRLNDAFRFRRNDDGSDWENTSLLPGVTVKEKINAQTAAIVKGFSLEANLAYLDMFIFQLGGTLQKSEYQSPELIFSSEEKKIDSNRILRSPNLYGFSSITYNPSDRWSFTWSNIYTGSMLVFHEVKEELITTPHFLEVHLKGTYKWQIDQQLSLDISMGVQNLFNSYQSDFDKGINRDSTYIYGPVKPRTPYVGLKLYF